MNEIRNWCKTPQCCRGSAAAELALLAPVLVGLIVGIVDVGRAIGQSITLNDAARAGSQRGYLELADVSEITGEIDAAVVSQVVAAVEQNLTESSGDADNVTVAAVIDCACSESRDASVDCNLACPDDQLPLIFVDVSVERPLDLFFSFLSWFFESVQTSSFRIR